MRARLSALVLLALATPALAAEIACEGAFGIDSSAARLIEIYGTEHVVTGMVPAPEGEEVLATTVFPNDPKKRLQFVWWDEAALSDPSYVELPAKLSTPLGIRIGMSLAEVEARNGEPFDLSGFGWDYGGFANFSSGNLYKLPGGCMLTLHFAPGVYPQGIDTASTDGDVALRSDDPVLAQMDVRIFYLAVGYPHPDFR